MARERTIHPDFKLRGDWLAGQVCMDSSLTRADLVVAAYLYRRLNGETMECFPSQLTMANALNLSEVTVGKAIGRLESGRHILVERTPQGSKEVHHYRLTLITQTGVRVMGEAHPNSQVALTSTLSTPSPKAELGQNTGSQHWKENTGAHAPKILSNERVRRRVDSLLWESGVDGELTVRGSICRFAAAHGDEHADLAEIDSLLTDFIAGLVRDLPPADQRRRQFRLEQR